MSRNEITFALDCGRVPVDSFRDKASKCDAKKVAEYVLEILRVIPAHEKTFLESYGQLSGSVVATTEGYVFDCLCIAAQRRPGWWEPEDVARDILKRGSAAGILVPVRGLVPVQTACP